MLHAMHASQECLERIVRSNPNSLLQEDRTVVDVLINEMNRDTSDRGSPREGIVNGVDARERREQRRVDIQDAILESTDQHRGENPHKSCQADEPHVMLIEKVDEVAITRFATGEGVGIDEDRGNARAFRTDQCESLGLIREDDGDARSEASRPHRVDDGLEIGALPRAQDRNGGTQTMFFEIVLCPQVCLCPLFNGRITRGGSRGGGRSLPSAAPQRCDPLPVPL